MHGSAPTFPPDLLELAIFDDYRNGRIAVGKDKHLLAVLEVVLGVEFLERDSAPSIEFACFLTVRAPWFCVDLNLQFLTP